MPARDQARTCCHSIAVLAGSVGKGSLNDVGEFEEYFGPRCFLTKQLTEMS
jgi:hypothetical protein